MGVPASNLSALKRACVQVATSAIWQGRPVDADEIAPLADQLTKVALEALEHFESLGADAGMVTRAVHYVGNVYSHPGQLQDVAWFSTILNAILEIACPNVGLGTEARNFMSDLQRGIERALEI